MWVAAVLAEQFGINIAPGRRIVRAAFKEFKYKQAGKGRDSIEANRAISP
jgi:hypothetical protein